ncbi:MAG: NAD(+) synthase [Oscillospiraceae bacterium]|nr:NAD(+) synthase [Oscillospiraceae bacterium]
MPYIRIACAVPAVAVGNVKKNAENICKAMKEADSKLTDVLVFPELALTGYTCGDLFFQETLLQAAISGLQQILTCSRECSALTVVVGLPIRIDGQLYNCAAVVNDGCLRGLVPKTYLPNYNEYSEKRWFADASQICQYPIHVTKLGLEGDYDVCLNTMTHYTLGNGVKLGVEICEDLWAPVAQSSVLALGGAEIIVNPAASNETVGKRAYRKATVQHQSAAAICGYAFCSAGATESTQDLVFSGHSIIAQNGRVLAENEDLIASDYMLISDVDVGMLRSDRARKNTFRDAAAYYGAQNEVEAWEGSWHPLRSDGSLFPVRKLAFIPDTEAERMARCKEIFAIQVAGLKHRLETIKTKAVIGISGGLDSTLALLVAVEAMRQLGRPATDVYGVTMPCFGTSDRTYNNAWELMRKLGVTAKEINIRDAVSVHFRDIGHDPHKHDTTYENSQARERTQILMDYAGEVGGIVVGTGDLSELALGWCTYNGDHMSMYGVNGAVPKTLIRWIIDTVSREATFAPAREVLLDVLDTPISPELLPPDAKGKISQQTEDIVGPYALHDFFLYYVLRWGFTPEKIFNLACRAFREDFSPETVKKWLVTFYRRFFSQQFKRNCQPDGVKLGSVGVGPRGDLHMPSDATAALWLEEAENL